MTILAEARATIGASATTRRAGAMQRNINSSLAVMLGPAITLLTVFILLPMLLTTWLSFENWSTPTGFDPARFAGLDNFLEIFGSGSVGRDFKGALANTAIYTVLSVILILPLSVAFGLLV